MTVLREWDPVGGAPGSLLPPPLPLLPPSPLLALFNQSSSTLYILSKVLLAQKFPPLKYSFCSSSSLPSFRNHSVLKPSGAAEQGRHLHGGRGTTADRREVSQRGEEGSTLGEAASHRVSEPQQGGEIVYPKGTAWPGVSEHKGGKGAATHGGSSG